jgi:hypothetical protein
MTVKNIKIHSLPTHCVVCGESTIIERVRCTECDTAVEGTFGTGWAQSLSPEQAGFARVFLEQRGKIKDVEQALGVSYPTVVSRLDEIVAALTGRPAPPRGAPSGRAQQYRKDVLDALAAGTIDAEEAARRLREAD